MNITPAGPISEDVAAAVAYALEAVAKERPPNPVAYVAQKLREYAIIHGTSTDPTTPRTAEGRRRSVARGRRQVIFAAPVAVDENWTPTVVPKDPETRESIARIMTKNVLFATLSSELLQTLIDVMVPKKFESGQTIIKQGDTGDFYYVVESGSCDIFKNGDLVLKVSTGMGFGELALMYDAPRAATVVATSPVSTWAIDRVSFKQVMMGTTERKRKQYAHFLEGVELLHSLSEAERLTIADALAPVNVKAGDVVVTEGDEIADRFYLVEKGELKATKAGVAAEVCPRLREGSYFGELALLRAQPRAATVTAVEDSVLLSMDRAAFLRLLGPMSDILKRNEELYSKYLEELPSAAEEESETRHAILGDD